ncbi:MAG: DUF1178 family protein [Proteobacteria bacterium]|nr:DUF1178 family protein [Pseudomonadota bacterium]MBU1388702.1 DUF1178 family protein [Pseudomonadota bacterium]MBU1541912.1 DUF1178 family protein [Pseudomonadota bacterium]MBU2480862.1 DUF1178 family protein [Pseudomonadota bacterium]
MIVFDLECLNGHTFEGWFEDKDDLNSQLQQGLLTCPVCDTVTVSQKVHAIAIRKSADVMNQKAVRANQEVMAELTEKVAEYVERNYEDVGTDFSKQALKMHYGAQEYRNIRGTTTKEEDKVLSKEGVPVLKVPILKKSSDDLN